jgi:hypothetical protein
MAGVERETDSTGGDAIVEVIAGFLAGKIPGENFVGNDRFVRDFYIGLMSEDEEFAARVNERKEQLLEGSSAKKEAKKVPTYIQGEFSFPETPVMHDIADQIKYFANSHTLAVGEHGTVFDSEAKIVELHKKFQSNHPYARNEVMNEEICFKRNQLREMIGLPIVRGKDSHIKDTFYKYLVKHVVGEDEFGIFNEYDRVIYGVPDDLEEKIGQVREFIGGVVDSDLNLREKYRSYREFKEGYDESLDQQESGNR